MSLSPPVWLGVQIALAWFCAVNIVASVATMVLHRDTFGTAAVSSPGTAAAWRLLPAALSILVTCGLVVPAFIWLEPRGTGEEAGWVIRVLAFAGAGILVAALGRGMRTARRNSRALKAATQGRRSVTLADAPVPAFTVGSRSPLLLLAGIQRPRLYVSDAVLKVLSPEELRAAVAHELAHQRAHDNLIRAAFAFAPDLLRGSLARRLERRWCAAAECAADAAAAGNDPQTALSLASALIKVARLRAGTPLPDFGCAAFDDGSPVAERVRRLVNVTGSSAPARVRARRIAAPVAVAMVAAAASWLPEILALTHLVTEFAVRLP